jgi:hypothetical protein
LGKIENNPGKIAVAKICLNSLWGKFGQRQNMGATEYVTDIKRFYEILLDDRLDNIHINELNDWAINRELGDIIKPFCASFLRMAPSANLGALNKTCALSGRRLHLCIFSYLGIYPPTTKYVTLYKLDRWVLG